MPSIHDSVKEALELYGMEETDVVSVEMGVVEMPGKEFFIGGGFDGANPLFLAKERDTIIHGADWWIDHLSEDWIFHCSRTFPRSFAPLGPP